MPELDWNKKLWDGDYDWSQQGEEWSSNWGGSESQWYWTLLPRIRKYLDSDTTLEIAPGFGRWSQYLLKHSKKLILVDLSSQCIEACKRRFSGNDNIDYHVNDGKSLSMIEDESLDLVFSFDSLVHCEADILDNYLNALKNKIKKDGVIILHHSNLGQYYYFTILRKLEQLLSPSPSVSSTNQTPGATSLLSKTLLALRITDRTHMRALSVSASILKSLAEKHGLVCVSQEIFPWGHSRRSIDCISVLTTSGSKWAATTPLVNNKSFMKHARSIKELSAIYR